MKVNLKIRRFNPEKDKEPWWGEYTIEAEPTDRLLDALNHVKWHIDGTLTYRRSCAHGVCGSDAMQINGANTLACKVLLKNLGNNIRVEPLRGYQVIKDLLVDLDTFFAKYRQVKPYLITHSETPEKERLQSVADRERFDDTTKCILCGACTSSCPSYWGNSDYVGPAAIVNAHRFIFDSRDEGREERLEVLNAAEGVWRCRTIFNCVEACPRGINVTRAIGEVKQALLDRKL
ncbi:MAG TPA: succinate dehydrogenase iron-sulfur subunit [Terriglobia bacterium]|nr:succinate dehydrogenase iron-sulfur subunit [Terriglobia bacterium]